MLLIKQYTQRDNKKSFNFVTNSHFLQNYMQVENEKKLECFRIASYYEILTACVELTLLHHQVQNNSIVIISTNQHEVKVTSGQSAVSKIKCYQKLVTFNSL